MNYEANAHIGQMKMLKQLLLREDASFSELQRAGEFESDAANFHIKQLTVSGYITKLQSGRYALTRLGKEYANRMDTDDATIEKQPKVAVCLVISDGSGRFLFQQRLKQPYYGYWGRPTGKIRWGETIMETAARELFEETGLTADISFLSVVHKMDRTLENDELLEDKIFFMMSCQNVQGSLIDEFEGGRNAWMTTDECAAQTKTFVIDELRSDVRLLEKTYHYSVHEY